MKSQILWPKVYFNLKYCIPNFFKLKNKQRNHFGVTR